MKKGIIFVFVLAFAIIFLKLISADVISINSGGNEGIIISPDDYIEGFFSCVPTTCVKLGYNCDSWSDKCGRTINCGSCSSGFTCSTGVCTSTLGGDTGGGGGGGGGGETTPTIVLNPTSINLTLSYNKITNMSQRKIQKIYITNNGNYESTLSISQVGLSDVVILGTTYVTVAPKETKEIQVDFISPFEEKDIFGIILIGGYKIPVFIHVTSNPLWFDSNIVVLNENYQVPRGEKLRTRVELIPMGEASRLDVTLDYVIRDTLGKIYLIKSETLLIEKRMNIDRDFLTGLLPVDKYIIELKLTYPGGVAPSSAYFEVTKMNIGTLVGAILFFTLVAILIVSMFIIILLIRRKRKKEKENNKIS